MTSEKHYNLPLRVIMPRAFSPSAMARRVGELTHVSPHLAIEVPLGLATDHLGLGGRQSAEGGLLDPGAIRLPD